MQDVVIPKKELTPEEIQRAKKIRQTIGKRNFDDSPACNLCGSTQSEPFITVSDGQSIVRCVDCDLLFTSPRPRQDDWEWFLSSGADPASFNLTKNRLCYGIALDHRISSQPENWRERLDQGDRQRFAEIRSFEKYPIKRVHDVGCGVGFFMQTLRDMGLEVSGNEMNFYACSVMRDQLGLDVRCGNFQEAELEPGSLDCVTMYDYIEHTFHPLEDLCCAYNALKPGGIVHVRTFNVECFHFDQKGADWDMLKWNHVYHFSGKTLAAMIEKAGFRILENKFSYNKGGIAIIAVKPKITWLILDRVKNIINSYR